MDHPRHRRRTPFNIWVLYMALRLDASVRELSDRWGVMRAQVQWWMRFRRQASYALLLRIHNIERGHDPKFDPRVFFEVTDEIVQFLEENMSNLSALRADIGKRKFQVRSRLPRRPQHEDNLQEWAEWFTKVNTPRVIGEKYARGQKVRDADPGGDS